MQNHKHFRSPTFSWNVQSVYINIQKCVACLHLFPLRHGLAQYLAILIFDMWLNLRTSWERDVRIALCTKTFYSKIYSKYRNSAWLHGHLLSHVLLLMTYVKTRFNVESIAINNAETINSEQLTFCVDRLILKTQLRVMLSASEYHYGGWGFRKKIYRLVEERE